MVFKYINLSILYENSLVDYKRLFSLVLFIIKDEFSVRKLHKTYYIIEDWYLIPNGFYERTDDDKIQITFSTEKEKYSISIYKNGTFDYEYQEFASLFVWCSFQVF